MASSLPPGAAKIQLAIDAYIQKVKNHGRDMETREGEVFDAQTFRLPGQNVLDGMILPDFTSVDTVRRFQSLQHKEGDVIVASYPKAGSMWVIELLWLLLHSADTQLARKIPNVLRCPHMERDDGMVQSFHIVEKMPSPRVMKTHLTSDLLPQGHGKVIYVMRNPKDILVSCYHFYKTMPEFGFRGSWQDFVKLFLAGNLHYGCYFDHVLSYWKHRHDARFLFIKYEDMIRDKRKELRRIEEFCGRHLPADAVTRICDVTTIDAMRTNPQTNFSFLLNNPVVQTEIPEFKDWKFYRKGVAGDWKGYISEVENGLLDKMIDERFGDTGLEFEYELDVNMNG